MLAEVKPHWEEEWQKGEVPVSPEMHRWFVTRPPAIRDLMLRFPPSCLVRTILADCIVPRPNTVGIVVSYLEPEDGTPQGAVTVSQHPWTEIRGVCVPSSLVVVGYYKNITPDLIRKILLTHGVY